jgi:hypothetical protein
MYSNNEKNRKKVPGHPNEKAQRIFLRCERNCRSSRYIGPPIERQLALSKTVAIAAHLKSRLCGHPSPAIMLRAHMVRIFFED